MAIVVNSDGALEYFDTFAALAQYNLDHADDTIESYNADVEEENSIVTFKLIETSKGLQAVDVVEEQLTTNM